MAKSNYEIIGSVVTNAKVWWNYMADENEMAGKYTVDLCFVEGQKELEKLGVEFLEKKTKGQNKGKPHDSESPWVTCKSMFPIDNVYHPNRTKFSEDELRTIGNGSEVKVKVDVIKVENKFGEFINPTVNQMVVTKLEEYTAPDTMDESLFEGIDGGALDDSVDEIFGS